MCPAMNNCTFLALQVHGMSQEEDNLSDSGHNSMSSLPPYRPPFRPHLAHIRSAAVLLSQLDFTFKRHLALIDFFLLFLMAAWVMVMKEILMVSICCLVHLWAISTLLALWTAPL